MKYPIFQLLYLTDGRTAFKSRSCLTDKLQRNSKYWLRLDISNACNSTTEDQ